MKKLIHIMTLGNLSRFLIAILGGQLFLFTVMSLPTGCATPQAAARASVESTHAIIQTVDKTRAVWASYVVSHQESSAGDPSALLALANKELSVRTALSNYQGVAAAVVTAQIYGGGTNAVSPAAIASLSAASANYLAVVASAMKP